MIAVIFIPVRTKNLNVSSVTNEDTRKTFVASRELNFSILIQNQSKENLWTSHIIIEQINIRGQRL